MRRPFIYIGVLAALFLAAVIAPCRAQVQPGGTFTPGHAVAAGNAAGTFVRDAGGAAGSGIFGYGYLTELGITNTGTPFCINDALTNAAAGYHQLCAGANALGGGLISYNAYGGSAGLGLFFNINGVTYGFPGPGNGNVMGPGSSVDKQVALFNGTAGTLLRAQTNLLVDSNGNLLNGATSAWFTQQLGYGISSFQGISPVGGGGVGGAARASDNAGGSATAIGGIFFGVNDFTGAPLRYAWANYEECRRYNTAGACIGIEIDATNLGSDSLVTINPYAPYLSGAAAVALQLAAGGGCTSSAKCWQPGDGSGAHSGVAANVSSYIALVANGALADKGIVIGCASIVGSACGSLGTSHALAMGAGMQIDWWTGAGPAIAAYIRSDVGNSSNIMGQVFANDAVNIYDSSTTVVATIAKGGAATFGTLSGGSANLGTITVNGASRPAFLAYSNDTGVYPTSGTTCFSLTDNFSNANAEVNFWNCQNSAGGFDWYQKTGASSASKLMALYSGLQIGAPTGADKGAGTINIQGTIWTNGTQGIATQTCTVNQAKTLIFTNGLLTGGNCNS